MTMVTRAQTQNDDGNAGIPTNNTGTVTADETTTTITTLPSQLDSSLTHLLEHVMSLRPGSPVHCLLERHLFCTLADLCGIEHDQIRTLTTPFDIQLA
jgi:hypothetical protein